MIMDILKKIKNDHGYIYILTPDIYVNQNCGYNMSCKHISSQSVVARKKICMRGMVYSKNLSLYMR